MLSASYGIFLSWILFSSEYLVDGSKNSEAPCRHYLILIQNVRVIVEYYVNWLKITLCKFTAESK